jgi:Fe-S cluster assembly protein SufD
MNTYDYIKYGIGIGTKTTEVGFGDLTFESGITVSSSFGTVAPLKKGEYESYVLQTGSEYTSNAIFAHITAQVTDKYIVRIPKEASGEVINIIIEQSAPHALGYLLVIVESGADVTIRETAYGTNFRGMMVDVVVEDAARCTYLIEHTNDDSEYMFGVHTARVMRDAQITWFDMNIGGRITKHSIVSHLVQPGADARTYGVFIGTDAQVYDLYTATEHLASHTVSDMFVRGVLGGASKAIYRGLVKVHTGASGCKGYQQQDTLLTSPKASVSSVPDLEILNNDVSCSHGVTTTRIDDLKLFYALSRGMSRADAERQFILGHAGAVIAMLPSELQAAYMSMIEDITI